jgi:electron transfer flavoprotein alpha/beta subunit
VKILVCMKQVPQKDAPLKLNEAGTWIREDVSYEVNEPDAFALEEALRQKEKHTGEVVVLTAGPARAMQVLREALAKGADRAIHLEDVAFVGLDAFSTARVIAAAIKDEKFDLIFTGLQSDDYGFAQTGVILAQILGWPHATIIMQIEKNEAGIRVKEGTGSWVLSVCRHALAGGADDSVGNQQTALCDADRHQAGQKQAAAQGHTRRGAVGHGRELAEDREAVCPAEIEEY